MSRNTKEEQDISTDKRSIHCSFSFENVSPHISDVHRRNIIQIVHRESLSQSGVIFCGNKKEEVHVDDL